MLHWLKEYGQTATNTLLLSYTHKATNTLRINFKIILILCHILAFDQHQSIWASLHSKFQVMFSEFHLRRDSGPADLFIFLEEATDWFINHHIMWIKWCKRYEHRLIRVRLQSSTRLKQSSCGRYKSKPTHFVSLSLCISPGYYLLYMSSWIV